LYEGTESLLTFEGLITKQNYRLKVSENFYKKAKLLLPTLLALPIVINLTIVFLRWINDAYLGVTTILEESWELTVPLFTIPIFIWFFVVPKIKFFNFQKGQRSGIFGYSLLIFFWLIFVCAFTQAYYTNASDTITDLPQVEQINNKPVTRYYRIRQGNLARIETVVFVKYYTSSKGSTLNMDIYFAIPIFSPGKFNALNKPYWYGVQFHRTMKNRQNASKKDSLAKRFFIECREELNTYTIPRAPYLIRSPNSKMNNFFIKAIQSRTGSFSQQPFVLIHPREEDFTKRNNNSLIGIIASFFIGLLIGLMPAFSSKNTLK
jgi:hypothetical protein